MFLNSEGDGELKSFLSFAPMPLFLLVLVRNEGAVVRDVFVDGAREKTVEGAREGAVVAVVWEEMRRVRLVNCCC